MKRTVKFLLSLIVFWMCFDNANADKVPCPEGCFCLNNGEIERDSKDIFILGGGQETDSNDKYLSVIEKKRLKQEREESYDKGIEKIRLMCGIPANPLAPSEFHACNKSAGGIKIGKFNIICDKTKYSYSYTPDEEHVEYNLNEFSEFYTDKGYSYEMHLGAYGRKGNDIIYFPLEKDTTQQILPCPVSYPLSESGAKQLQDCFTYDAKGDKEYYQPKKNNNVIGTGVSVPINLDKIPDLETASKNVSLRRAHRSSRQTN